MYPNAYPKQQSVQQEPTITVREHNELLIQQSKDTLLVILLVTLGIVLFMNWRRKRQQGGWN